MDFIAPNFGLFFWLTIVFILLMVILSKYAWKPIVAALETREANIEDSITRAEKALAEAKQIAADNDKARREAEIEAQRIIREAKEAADELRSKEMEKTKAQLTQMQNQAQAEIEREKQSAINTLRAEVANLAINAAEKVVKESLDTSKHRKLVEDFIGTLPSNSN